MAVDAGSNYFQLNSLKVSLVAKGLCALTFDIESVPRSIINIIIIIVVVTILDSSPITQTA